MNDTHGWQTTIQADSLDAGQKALEFNIGGHCMQMWKNLKETLYEGRQ